MRQLIKAYYEDNTSKTLLSTILCVDSDECDHVNFHLSKLSTELIIDDNPYNLENSEYDDINTSLIELIHNGGIITESENNEDLVQYSIGSIVRFDENNYILSFIIPKKTNLITIESLTTNIVLDQQRINIARGTTLLSLKYGKENLSVYANRIISQDFNVADNIDNIRQGETYACNKLYNKLITDKLSYLYNHNKHVHDLISGRIYFTSHDNPGSVLNETVSKLGRKVKVDDLEYICVADTTFNTDYQTYKDFIPNDNKWNFSNWNL